MPKDRGFRQRVFSELKPEEEEFFLLVYDRALATADEIVNHYLKKCELDKNEKIIVTFEKGE